MSEGGAEDCESKLGESAVRHTDRFLGLGEREYMELDKTL